MRRSLVAALATLALLAGCASAPVRPPRFYVVRPHDTLYSIAWRNRLNYRDLAAWNHIGPDFRIRVGERLRLRPPAGLAARRLTPPRAVPAALFEQLAVGGRLVAPVGAEGRQTLVRHTRGETRMERETLGAVSFVPLLSGLQR